MRTPVPVWVAVVALIVGLVGGLGLSLVNFRDDRSSRVTADDILHSLKAAGYGHYAMRFTETRTRAELLEGIAKLEREGAKREFVQGTGR